MALRVWLPLDGDLHNQGISSLPPLSFNNFTTSSNGKIGNCYKGWGIYHLNEEILGNCWSVSAWIKADSWYSSNNIIICKNVAAGDVYQIYFSIFGTNQIRLGINNASGITYNGYTFTTGTWHHVVGTYDGKVGTIYINGEEKTHATVTNAFVSGMNNLSLGCRGLNAAGTNAWVGNNGTDVRYLNDVRIYDHCLSAAEVKEIAQGLVLHYKLDDAPILCKTNLTSWTKESGVTSTAQDDGSVKIDCTAKTSSRWGIYCDIQNVLPNTPYTFSVECKTANSAKPFQLSVGCNPPPSGSLFGTNRATMNSTSGFTTYTATVTTTATTTYIRFYLACNCSTTTPEYQYAFVKNVKMTIGTSLQTTIQDSSGYNHNGTIVGSVMLAADAARYGISTHIDGAGVITTTTPGADIRTLSCWVKTTKNKSTSQMLVADSASNMCISFYQGAIIGVFGPTRSTGSKSILGTSYKENNWNHIVVVKTSDDGKRDIYCNGEKLTPVADDYWNVTGGFFIGQRNGTLSGNTPFFGYISDVRAYCTPLLDTDIKQLYNVGMKVDNLGNIHTYELEETDGQNKILKTGITKSANFFEDLYYDEIAHIGKQMNDNILSPNDLEIITTNNSSIKTGSLGIIPAETIQALAGKTLIFSYDVCTTGERLSEVNGDTAYNKVRYGIHGSMTYVNASGTSGTNYPFTSYLTYSGNSKHTVQTWTIPINYQSYGNLSFAIQNFDMPSNNNSNTWFIKNVRLEVQENTTNGWISGTNLIEM